MNAETVLFELVELTPAPSPEEVEHMLARVLADAGGNAEEALRTALESVLRYRAAGIGLAGALVEKLTPPAPKPRGRPPKQVRGLHVPAKFKSEPPKRTLGAPKQHGMKMSTKELAKAGAELVEPGYNAKMAAKYLIAKHGEVPTEDLVANLQRRISDTKRTIP